MERSGCSPSFLPTKSAPRYAERPPPKRLTASPVAYWFVLSQMTSQPKHAATTAPAPAPAAKPIQSLPVWKVTAYPASAPTSIIPSAPRLRMPTRSLMRSPRPAMASGVPELRVAAMSRATSFTWTSSSAAGTG